MKAKKIRNEDDLTAAFIHLESIFQAEQSTPRSRRYARLDCFG